jgi:hypothetical protein
MMYDECESPDSLQRQMGIAKLLTTGFSKKSFIIK